MQLTPPTSAEAIYQLYESLTQASPLNPDSGLGGKLLYAGEIDGPGRNLLFAANVAGAASLAASADPAAQRQAIRDGVVDFLVTSLEEALRILKNEVRKHQAVSVGVAIAPAQLEAQMLDRGVLPDLRLPDLLLPDRLQPDASRNFITWQVDRDHTRWLPKLDAIVQSLLPPADPRQRWLRLAPRYLGRLAQKQHSVALTPEETTKFRTQTQQLEATPNITIEIQ
jgi:urocanate hydratase